MPRISHRLFYQPSIRFTFAEKNLRALGRLPAQEGSLQRVSTVSYHPDAIEFSQLPARFRRELISQEEMDVIEMGGVC